MSANGPSKKQEYLTEEQQGILSKKATEIERLQTDITSLAKPLLSTPDGSVHDWSKHVTPGTLSVFQEGNSWNRVQFSPESGLLKRKYPSDIPNTGAFKKMRDIIDSFDEADDSLSDGELSPTVSRFDSSERKTFGTNTMEEDVVVLKCKTCNRPILASSFRAHSESCGRGDKKPRALTQMESSSSNDKSKAKNFFSDDDDDDDDPIALKRQNDPASKKRKQTEKLKGGEGLDDPASVPAKRPPSTNDKPEKKKSKKEKQKQKATPKQKAPLDLDKQCGVIQGPNNTPCTRSLTCKSHSMGAKRAVAGRSQPYDVLLSAYQKKAIGRPQSTGTNASTNKSTVVAKATKTNAKKLQNQTASPGLAGATVNATDNVQPNEEQYVNSDEEVESVIEAIRQSCPAPLAEKPFYFVKRRRQCYRLRDILLDTITPKSALMAHSDSNSSLSSLFNTSPSVHASPLHSQQPSTPQQQQTQLHLPHHSFQPAAMLSSQASAAMNRISQPALGSAGMSGPPLGMIGFSGSMDAGNMFASTNGAVRDTYTESN